MEWIALAPVPIVLAVARFRSLGAAFLNVYLPLLLLVPNHYRLFVEGLPDLGLQHAAILALAVLLPFATGLRWRFSSGDVLVGAFAAAVAYSQYRVGGWHGSQNLSFDTLCRVILPYALAKALIEPRGLRVAFAKRFVLLLFVVATLSVWEFRMGSNPFFAQPWDFFFPGQDAPRTTYRLGYARITGPFTHAILAGIVLTTGLILHSWLQRNGAWGSRLRGWVVAGGLVLGVLMSLSRGPWTGLLVGATFVVFGYVRFRTAALVRVLLLVLVVAPPALAALNAYASVSRSEAQSTMQESAAYRLELLEAYSPVILEHPAWGWGHNRWPVDRTLRSIDNHYLLMALDHGLIALALFILLIGWTAVQLTWCAGHLPPKAPTTSLAYTLLGALACMAVAIVTVWLGAQTLPVLFLLVGWAEGLLLACRPEPLVVRPAFRRVLV